LVLKSDIKQRLGSILSGFCGSNDELIPILQSVQGEFGYLSEEVLGAVARFLRLSPGHVFGVATFYSQFRLSPVGRQVIRVCRGTACHVRGTDRIIQEIEQTLGIKPGETTPDLEYSLETIACVGSCALAPVMVVDKTVHGRMMPSEVADILSNAK
jgi:NADH-quinone oxidoreductase subunit E